MTINDHVQWWNKRVQRANLAKAVTFFIAVVAAALVTTLPVDMVTGSMNDVLIATAIVSFIITFAIDRWEKTCVPGDIRLNQWPEAIVSIFRDDYSRKDYHWNIRNRRGFNRAVRDFIIDENLDADVLLDMGPPNEYPTIVRFYLVDKKEQSDKSSPLVICYEISNPTPGKK